MGTLFDIRVCDAPGCGGILTCPSVGPEAQHAICHRGWFDPQPDEDVIRWFEIELAGAIVRDSKGVQRMVPPGCEFTIHKGHGGLPANACEEGRMFCVAVCSGPKKDRDAILAAAPEWGHDQVRKRWVEIGNW